MKKVFLSLSVAIFGLLPTATVMAADLDTLPPPPTGQLRPATYDWSGAYVGAFVGAACIDGILTENTTATPFLNAGCGFKGGGLVGYNFQTDDIVWGLEGSAETTTNLVSNTQPGADFHYKMDYIGRLNARIGWAMDDNLLFVMAGGAYGRGHLTDNWSTVQDQLYGDHWGWSVGAGWEHAFTDQFHFRLDYMYTHFNDVHYIATCVCDISGGPGNEHEVRAAAIWAF